MQTLAASVWHSMSTARPQAVLIAQGGSNWNLVWWLPVATLRLAWLLMRRRVEVVLTGDALAHAAVAPLLRLLRVKNATMIMGRDLTFQNRLYQAFIRPQLRRAHGVLAISAATAASAVALGVPQEQVTVIRLGVPPIDVSAADRAAARASLHARLHLADTDIALLTLGRLVRRKGARWFIETVLPKLPNSVHYLIAGAGPEAAALRSAAVATGQDTRVHLLGQVDDDEREELLRGADIFVQPNIPVVGDLEGFGLVTVEAALRGTPVLAADLEGIRDAVMDGATGILLPPGLSDAWVERIVDLTAEQESLPALGHRFQIEASTMYSEQAMGRALCDALGIAQ